MLSYIIDSLLGRRTKCWKCIHFLDHDKIKALKLPNEPRNIHVGFCNKIKDYYESCPYNSRICKDFKRY